MQKMPLQKLARRQNAVKGYQDEKCSMDDQWMNGDRKRVIKALSHCRGRSRRMEERNAPGHNTK